MEYIIAGMIGIGLGGWMSTEKKEKEEGEGRRVDKPVPVEMLQCRQVCGEGRVKFFRTSKIDQTLQCNCIGE